MANTQFNQIITVYHTGKREDEDRDRLFRSVRSSERELAARNGRLILVANGTDDGAIDPRDLVESALPASTADIMTISIKSNKRYVQAMNRAVAEALKEDDDEGLICSVQPSAVLQDDWLNCVESSCDSDEFLGAATRLVIEGQDHYIRSDGHYQKCGCTLDRSFGKLRSTITAPTDRCNDNSVVFPCLSAAAYKADVVRRVCKEYGNFICPVIFRNGDCTDIGLRIMSSYQDRSFAFAEEAVATKRWSDRNDRTEIAAQIFAAETYYTSYSRKSVVDRAKKSDKPEQVIDAAEDLASEMLSNGYASDAVAPRAESFDCSN